MTSYQKLEKRFRTVHHLQHAQNVITWDEAVMMPSGGSSHRNSAVAELSGVVWDLVRAEEVGEWFQDALGARESLSPWQSANLESMRKMHIECTAVPSELNQRLVMARMNCEQNWRKLRGENNWAGFLPYLAEVLSLVRESTQALQKKKGLSLYDTALSTFSPGLDTATIEKLFNELKSFLPGMIQEVVAKQKTEKVIIPEGPFPMLAQKSLGLELMKAIGFSFEHGRLDEAFHPFCGGNPRDVRITTRYREDEFISSLMGVLHETGHALYEQNLPDDWLTQPVGGACGMAIHESQSLLMEMQVCRSQEFLTFAAPLIRKHIGPYVKNPESLETSNLVKLVTRVNPDFIRVDADEVTYPAHIILRFEIERDLLEDRWPLSELPAVWDKKMREYLGLSTLGNDKNGCMQDVHWPSGAFGYFPAYTFGAVIAAQLFAKATEKIPGVRQELATGNFAPLQGWLRENIWSRGSSLKTLEIVSAASGPLTVNAFQRHLQTRYL
jgi:carboxypeptidase Taq